MIFQSNPDNLEMSLVFEIGDGVITCTELGDMTFKCPEVNFSITNQYVSIRNTVEPVIDDRMEGHMAVFRGKCTISFYGIGQKIHRITIENQTKQFKVTLDETYTYHIRDISSNGYIPVNKLFEEKKFRELFAKVK